MAERLWLAVRWLRLRAVARRFGYGTVAAIVVLLATGAAMASHYDRRSDGVP
jgi:uncharacterized membrane protein